MSSALPSGGVSGDGGDVFDSTDFDTISGDGSKSRLGSGSGGLVSSSSSGSKLDVNGGDVKGFESIYDINSSHHCGVGR